jgi:hypothetical protein
MSSRRAAQKTGNTVITVEDHYLEGGLGDAVAGELSADGIKVHKLAVTALPRSGKPENCWRTSALTPPALSKRSNPWADLAREVLWVEAGNEAHAFRCCGKCFRKETNHATPREISLDFLADGRFLFWPVAVGAGRYLCHLRQAHFRHDLPFTDKVTGEQKAGLFRLH